MAIISEEIVYQIDNNPFTGYLAFDDSNSSPKPAVTLVHEWWGHDEFVRCKADRLASEGFIAFALDMFGSGIRANGPEEAGALMGAVTSAPGLVEKRFMAAFDLVYNLPQVDASNIHGAGYCFGGEVVLEMARAGKALKSVTSFHGLLETKTPMVANNFDGLVLAFNGIDDPLAPPETVKALVDEMSAAEVRCEVTNYPGVMHAFTNPASDHRSKSYNIPILKYDEQADEDSHQKMVAALKLATS